MKKILVVSYCFPPINMIAAKRFGTMCKYFKENGYEPYILTTKPDGDWGLDVEQELDLPVDQKQIIQIGNHRNNGIVESLWGNYLFTWLADHRYSSRTVNAIAFGWYEKVKTCIDLTQLEGIDIVVGTFPVIGDLYVAYYLSRKLKCPYIIDIRDLISDYTETPEGYKKTKLLDCIIERYILKKAAGIVTVTPGFRNILRKRYPQKPFKVVFNGWDCFDKESCRNVEEKYLYYAGSIYQHRIESFKLLISCIRKINSEKTENVKLIVRSIGPKALDVKLRRLVEQNGMQEYISILEAGDESVVRAEQEQAYINVVLSTIHEEDTALMTTIPGKVYELLIKHAPILAVVPHGSDVDKVLQYTNKGIASVSEDEIVDFIFKGCEQYKGNRNIKYFTRRKQAKRFCRFTDQILGL